MAKKQTTPRPARTPREVLAPKVAAIAAMSPDQLAARAAELDQARAALKAAGDAAAAAQAAFDAVASDATDEQRDNARNALEGAERAVKIAEAKLKELTSSEGETAKPAEPTSPPAAGGGEETAGAEASASAATAGAAAAANAPATISTHPPEQSDPGGAGNGAGPAAGDHAELAAGILVVTTKRASRWRAGRQFTKGGETRIPMVDLTEAQFRAISEDPVLESHVDPS